MFENFPLEGFPVSEMDRVVRRTLWSAVGVAIVAVAASVSLHYPLVGPGVVLGLGLGLLNHRLFQASAGRVTADDAEDGPFVRKVLRTGVARRLGGITVVAFALVWLVPPMGWGVMGGLAAFQLLLIVNALKTVLAFQRGELDGDPPAGTAPPAAVPDGAVGSGVADG